MRIGIDLMGSDTSPESLFKAVLQAAGQFQDIDFSIFATQQAVDKFLSNPSILTQIKSVRSNIIFQVVSEVIEMNDEPVLAIRKKKNSSLVVGMRNLKKNCLDAFVSAGNTGALIASATLSLPFLPGIRRPALLATLPTKKGYVAVIDVGGNVSCKAHHLVQFALMGAAYQRSAQGIEIPRVGLLNIGVESKKGTSEVRRAYEILQEKYAQSSDSQKIQFIGNIEGKDVFQGKADVVVTDGFTGNVLLKTSEGTSYFILDTLKIALQKIPDLQREEIFRNLKMEFDANEYGGAIICGVDRVAVKCHGHASEKGFYNGILGAIELVNNGFTKQLKNQLQN